MPSIDYRQSIEGTPEIANRDITKKLNNRTIKLVMITTKRNANWAADKALKAEAYPLAEVTLSVNRDKWSLERGDLFRFNFAAWSVVDMVCRVTSVVEESLTSEDLKVTATEEVEYLATSATTGGGNEELVEGEVGLLEPLANVKIIESPYVMAGPNDIGVIPLVGKVVGTELGFFVYMSVDGGLSYTKIGFVPAYAVHGTLVHVYNQSRQWVDDTHGFYIDLDSPVGEFAKMQTITRAQLLAGKNLAVLGDEIVGVQTVTPATTTRYHFLGIYRARFDTIKQTHAPGTHFYFVSDSYFKQITDGQILTGASRKFKLVPYNSTTTGVISDAIATTAVIAGRNKKPYMPFNLRSNGKHRNCRYSDDIVLTWDGRYRGEGAGLGIPASVTDTSPTWEGYFKVEVYVSDVLVRTVLALNALTYTYTDSYNIDDNGGLANTVVFKVSNYQVESSVTYESAQTTITVDKES